MLPLILRIAMTTTLISLSTPRPLKVIPLIKSAHDTMTIVASNKLNLSLRKPPFEAKVFRSISMKKMKRKTRSILLSISGSILKKDDMVKSNRMKIE